MGHFTKWNLWTVLKVQYTITPFIIFWKGKCRKHYNPKCFIWKIPAVECHRHKWPWASTINNWMITPRNCQEKSQKCYTKLSYSYLSLQNTQTSTWIRCQTQPVLNVVKFRHSLRGLYQGSLQPSLLWGFRDLTWRQQLEDWRRFHWTLPTFDWSSVMAGGPWLVSDFIQHNVALSWAN